MAIDQLQLLAERDRSSDAKVGRPFQLPKWWSKVLVRVQEVRSIYRIVLDGEYFSK